ncbi:hypothetical protein U3A55_09470 [Salarchaeum sp. III]|uniref:hypothetical protein n=1 Tax=Salarchaeum sp. III TaxID=3107927 RepID=UPI002ED9F59E
MSNSDDRDTLPVYDPDDVPDDAAVLQNGMIVGENGPLGRIDKSKLDTGRDR